ncbi:hypothetical protein BST61_g5657 [Cercospora zeina]
MATVRGLRAKRLENSHAYHSRIMDPVASELLKVAEDLRINAPSVEIEACVPTFFIHGTSDDHVPWQQTQRTYDGMRKAGVSSELAILEDAPHLFDMHRRKKQSYVKAVVDG